MHRWLLLYRAYQQPRKTTSGTPDGRNTWLYIQTKTSDSRLLRRNAVKTRRLCSRASSKRVEPQEKRSFDEGGLEAALETVEGSNNSERRAKENGPERFNHLRTRYFKNSKLVQRTKTYNQGKAEEQNKLADFHKPQTYD